MEEMEKRLENKPMSFETVTQGSSILNQFRKK